MVSVHLFHCEQDKEKYFSETWKKRVMSALALSSQLPPPRPPRLSGNLKADTETAKPFLHMSENPLFQIEICITSSTIHINLAQVMLRKVELDRTWLETNIQSKDGAQTCESTFSSMLH